MTEHRRRGRGARPGTRQQDPRITKPSETAVGAQLREDRERLDLSQAWVADRLDILQERLSRYETGRTKRPDPEHLRALAKLYGRPEGYYVGIAYLGPGDELVAQPPPASPLQIPQPRAGLDGFLDIVAQLSDRDFKTLINAAAHLTASARERTGE